MFKGPHIKFQNEQGADESNTITSATTKDSDHTGQPYCLVRVIAASIKKTWVFNNFLLSIE